MLNTLLQNLTNPLKYAFVAPKPILDKSSSGGAFTVMAEKVLQEGGYVVGVAFKEDFSAQHIVINSIDDLDKIRLSKYSQSEQNDCYRKTLSLLKDQKVVLYCGCPCQIAGLNNYIQIENRKSKFNLFDYLYTIDLLCHGVPSNKLLKEHLDRIYGLNNIKKISMRDTKAWKAGLYVELKDNSIINRQNLNSIFIESFLKDLILRDSCYGCKFSSLPRQGDVTIGDCWTVKKLGLAEPYNIKSSVVLANNEKGRILWEKSSQDCKFVKNLTSMPLNLFNGNISRPSAKSKSPLVDRFWQIFSKSNKFEEAAYKTLHNYDVGLILYASNNYGSCITNYALYKVIELLGHNPVILDSLVEMRGISKTFLLKKANTSNAFLAKDDYIGANFLCDSFVVGSDYSLNYGAGFTLKNYPYFLLSFADDNKNKIAYAPSLGTPNLNYNKYTKSIFKYMLSRFDFLSFREVKSVEFCKNNFNLDATTVIDPVFLLDDVEYYKITAEASDDMPTGDFVLSYILDVTPEKKTIITECSKIYWNENICYFRS